jgi:DNA-directed RNA polymerase specialized sigma24 family protein
VNREERLRRELPADLAHRAAELASLPVAQVDLIVGALRLAHRAGREHERQVRRQRVADRRKYNHIEDHQQADATSRQALALARRAGSSLDTLALLQQFYDEGPSVLGLAVAGLRAQGYSDGEIGRALGITRAAVGQRFGRKRDLYAGLPATGDPA